MGGGGGGWKAEGRLNYPWAQRQSHCVFSETVTETATVYFSGQDGGWQQPDTTCNLIALLVHTSGTMWAVMNVQDQKNAACESRPGYL